MTAHIHINTGGSSGGEGTTDYNKLSNKPSINGHELKGDQNASDLGLQNMLYSGQWLGNINGQSVGYLQDNQIASFAKTGKKELRDEASRGRLIPGQWYLVTDYYEPFGTYWDDEKSQSVWQGYGDQAWPVQLLVQAASPSTLFEDALAMPDADRIQNTSLENIIDDIRAAVSRWRLKVFLPYNIVGEGFASYYAHAFVSSNGDLYIRTDHNRDNLMGTAIYRRLRHDCGAYSSYEYTVQDLPDTVYLWTGADGSVSVGDAIYPDIECTEGQELAAAVVEVIDIEECPPIVVGMTDENGISLPFDFKNWRSAGQYHFSLAEATGKYKELTLARHTQQLPPIDIGNAKNPPMLAVRRTQQSVTLRDVSVDRLGAVRVATPASGATAAFALQDLAVSRTRCIALPATGLANQGHVDVNTWNTDSGATDWATLFGAIPYGGRIHRDASGAIVATN